MAFVGGSSAPSLGLRTLQRRLFPVGLVLALVLAAAPTALAAKSIHGELGSGTGVGAFGSAGSGVAGGQFADPRDIAVNESGAGAADPGDFYVVDLVNNRVQAFDSDGNFKFAFGRNVIKAGAPGDLGDAFEKCTSALNCQAGSRGTTADAPTGEIEFPRPLAVDQDTGSVFVADDANRRIQVFDGAGGFERMWGWNVVAEGATEDTLTDQFEVCTIAADCQKGASGSGVGQIGALNSENLAYGIAISAPDGNPASGKVFLADSANRRISSYNLDGSAPASIGSSTNFASGSPQQIAVDSQGIVYASDTSSNGQIDRYDSAGVHSAGTPGFIASILSPALGGTGVTNGMEVDLDSDGAGADEDVLYVLRDPSSGNTHIRQYGPVNDPGAAVAPTASDDTHVPTEFGTASNFLWLGIDSSTGTLYTGLSGFSNPEVQNGVFFIDDDGATATIAASVTVPTDVQATSAVLNGVVDPGGLARWRMEVSTDGVNFTPVEIKRPANGSTPVPVSVTASGLSPNTQYRFRIFAEKVLSTTNVISTLSAEGTFLTDAIPPTATTLPVSERRSTSAVLSATVNPNGSPTDYYFEYGPTTGYGQRVPFPSGSAGSGATSRVVTQLISGLEPGTTYHYRVVAESDVGTATGGDVSFTTRGVDSSSSARAYEMVSIPDKLGGQGTSVWYTGVGAHATTGWSALDGEQFYSATGFGGVLIDAAFAFASDAVFDRRTPAGWEHEAVINRGGYDSETFRMLAMKAGTDDFSMTLWGSNGGIMNLFPEQEGWGSGLTEFDNPHVRDRAGRWEPATPLDPSQAWGAIVAETFAADGSAFISTNGNKGVAGSGDPTLDTAVTPNVWLQQLPEQLTDSFPGASVRIPANVCTDGTEIPLRTADGKQGAQPCPAPAPGRQWRLIDDRGAAHQPGIPTALSEDGSRVFFTSPIAVGLPSGVEGACTGVGLSTRCPGQLYVREERGGVVRTRWISRSEIAGQDASLMAPVAFEGASVDGDKVFFRTAAPLTADDPNGSAQVPGGVVSGTFDSNSVDLYMYDMPDGEGADPADGTLTRISAGPTGDADPNVAPVEFDVAGLRFVSEGASKLYFTSAAPIPGAVVPAGLTAPGGTAETTDQTNLYLYDAAKPVAQRWRFVARLASDADSNVLSDCASRGSDPKNGTFRSAANTGKFDANVGLSCVRGTPDGEFITFFTPSRLTADDPDANSGDLYAYDAVSGELSRVSAPQGGAGGAYECAADAVAPCYATPHITNAARTPTLGMVTEPAVEGDRVVFFMSASRLVADDVDDVFDVYQWRNGDLSLLSVGTVEDTSYLGNDRDGRNVYMGTRDRLTWQDFDRALDIYTARVGGGISQPQPPSMCGALAGVCQGAGVGAPLPISAVTDSPGGRDAREVRATVRLSRVGAAQLARLAAGRRVALKVGVSGAGRVTVTGSARVGAKTRRVLWGSRTAPGAGTVRVRVVLSRAARARVRRGGRLVVSLRATVSGAARSSSARIVVKSKASKRPSRLGRGGGR
ncbi:MAG TPA: hypothetical protein VHF90_01925 [Thermoleophilaceae bacterium]|nr:hypothetical protein [Thermoleophilaceae bacterium]